MALFKKKLPELVAAIDLGSNSFHMIIARLVDGNFQIVDRIRELVRLSAGLDSDNHISLEAQARAFACLQKFGQRVQNIPSECVRTVGTNALRQADNTRSFLEQAEQHLGHPIQIISGIEEARLIYSGVMHDIADYKDRRLVIDIGGGSTEVIIGKEFTPQCMESLYMGCVSMTQRFFPDGRINPTAMKKAEIAARVELAPIANAYQRVGWQQVIGASGTIKAINRVTTESGWCEHGISLSALKKTVRAINDTNHIDTLDIKGLTEERLPAFPGGVAILYGLFKALDIQHMDVSDCALREGLLHDLLGRIHHEDIRSRSVELLANRYSVDTEQAGRIESTTQQFLEQVTESWDLADFEASQWLGWAVRLHESGLGIAHSHFHKHSAYIAENTDLFGFTFQDQQFLALLIRSHRRKLPKNLLKQLPKEKMQIAKQLIVILRLSVLLHRSRSTTPLPEIVLRAKKKKLSLTFPDGWLDSHPLSKADLEQEVTYLNAIEFDLKFNSRDEK